MFRPSRQNFRLFLACWLAAFAATFGFAPVLHAQDKGSKQLQGVEAALQASQQKAAALAAAAAALKREIAPLQASLVERAAAAQQAERELSELEETVAALMPPGTALVSENPLDLARGDLLLRVAVPELQLRAQALQLEIGQLTQLGREIDGRRARAQLLASELESERQTIAELLQKKADLLRQTAAKAAAADTRSAKLAAEAKDLKDLLDKLAADKQQEAAVTPKPDSIRPFPMLSGSLIPPVSGQIIARFGAPDATGSLNKGILLETRPEATVVAPFDGQVLFRGPFRSYGEILIIQHSGGYHSLLAGLARSNAVVGQWVLAGEPVGEMGPSKDGNPKLYMELRRDGHPIDPAPWLGKSDSKVE